uniref:Uncharacterized protein n=1 Tax=Glycine max TaxID=3847 RepID=C6TAP9_SOYBN|nr:unknown [Glycine max]
MANAPCLRCSSLVLPSLTPTSSSQSLSLASHTYLPSWKLIGNKYSTKKSLGKVKAVYANEFWAPETSSSQGIWSIRAFIFSDLFYFLLG